MDLLFARRFRESVAPVLLGGYAAAIALTPAVTGKLILLGPLCAAALLSWILYRPSRWLYVFFFSLLALPPLPAASGGDSGIHVAPLAAAIGLFVGLIRLRIWRTLRGSLAAAFLVFLVILLMSTGFAAFYSGAQIAIGSLARVFLFSLGVYVFAYTVAASAEESPDPLKFARFLFWLATGVVVFACFDFYFQFPAPAGYGPQFVWVGDDVIRRAQGLFYEASTLGNFCAFFLVLILVCLFHPKSDIPVSKPMLGAAGAVFVTAMIFSYSRGSVINLVCAAGALAWLRRGSVRLKRGRAPMALIGLTLTAGIAVQTLLPSFSANYWSRITGSIQAISSSPDSVLSGRLTSWIFLGDFLQRQPWTAVFGIGYKTLPYSDYVGATVVADNTYLQLLVETGIIGLVSFLVLNAAILRTGLRAARSPRPAGRIFGEWIFCFWVGQAVQMLSGDLITYWRVLPVYFWVLAIAERSEVRFMNILILDQFSEPGGAQLCLRDLAPEIARRGWSAAFVAPGDGAIRESLEKYGIRNERLPGIGSYNNGRKTIGDVARYALDIPRAIFGTSRLCREMSPDLVYVNGPRVLPVSMLFRCPIVFHSHNLLVKGYARAITAACLRLRRVETIAASKFVARAVSGSIAANRMRVVYSGVPDAGFVARRARGEVTRIGIIGRIAPEKGHLDLMHAVKMLAAQGKRVEVVIYGISMFSAAGYEARVRAEAAGISVRFAGWAQDVSAALHEIDVLAVPSSSIEAAARVIMEALSAGTPVVAYPSGGIPELICDGRTGLLTEQPTPASLARSIARLLADPALSSRLAEAGRREWEARFRVERYQREVCDFFESVVTARAAHSQAYERAPAD